MARKTVFDGMTPAAKQAAQELREEIEKTSRRLAAEKRRKNRARARAKSDPRPGQRGDALLVLAARIAVALEAMTPDRQMTAVLARLPEIAAAARRFAATSDEREVACNCDSCQQLRVLAKKASKRRQRQDA